jgi:hypothetical protein
MSDDKIKYSFVSVNFLGNKTKQELSFKTTILNEVKNVFSHVLRCRCELPEERNPFPDV